MMLIILVLIYAGLLFLAFRLIIGYATRVTGRFLERRHYELSIVVATGRAPKHWLGIQTETDFECLGESDRRRALRKLRRLSQYVKRSSLIGSEDDRVATLKKLEVARRYWKTAPVEDIVAA